ncbi:arf-GAP domain and FG repeat-containing protein 2 [Thamnophis elegans]|uniref:arf-GAP domain and FG repeat-containing protein 2 n=1 Tax=Thamnophis elegans TaxID=35005 RepID=UPI001376F98E|nr:arf-GAP domain and FG repeat-containing protein 2 [Thamnophis elegans]
MAAGGGGGGGSSASGSRKPGSPRDSESEVWSRRVRELVSAEPASRLCFECGQRGVTYVDITIGSFVCTACSGALRGLNPPHRVKSISMTTFTEGEVQFLQSRGNEACRKIWLGSFDSRSSLLPDSLDPQKVKEFLQEKYEKKRWYVSPDQGKSLAAPSAQASPAGAKMGAKTPQVSEKVPPPAAQPPKKASTDLLADIGGDPFAAPPPRPAFSAFGGSGVAHPAFPGFDAFGGGPAGATFGDPLASSQSPFQSHPITAGVAQAGPFPASPASQPGVGIPSLGGGFRMGAVPSSVFGPLGQAPVLPPSSPAAVFGAPTCTNPFTSPAVTQPTLPSTNPFQTNGFSQGSFLVGSPGSFSGPFASPLPQEPLFFPTQGVVGQPHNGGSPFGARPLGPPAGYSTNPFVNPMAAAPSPPFAQAKHPPTNPFS